MGPEGEQAGAGRCRMWYGPEVWSRMQLMWVLGCVARVLLRQTGALSLKPDFQDAPGYVVQDPICDTKTCSGRLAHTSMIVPCTTTGQTCSAGHPTHAHGACCPSSLQTFACERCYTNVANV